MSPKKVKFGLKTGYNELYFPEYPIYISETPFGEVFEVKIVSPKWVHMLAVDESRGRIGLTKDRFDVDNVWYISQKANTKLWKLFHID